METERILLRHWQESDAESLFKYASDPDVGPRAGWPAHKSAEESREIIRTFFHNETTWAIVLKETGEAIGCIGYYTHETSNIPIGENDCEVGYWVGKPYWNKGICTEALKLMLDYCINEKHFENIWADHFTGILHREESWRNAVSLTRECRTDAASLWVATRIWSKCLSTQDKI